MTLQVSPTPIYLNGLNGIRAIAAFGVMINHISLNKHLNTLNEKDLMP